MAPVTEEQCRRAQEACSRTQAATVALAISEGLQPLGGIEEQIRNVDEKLAGLPELYDRVKNLEVWKANLNGRAAALAEAAPHEHHREADARARLHERMEDFIEKMEAHNSRPVVTTTTTTTTPTDGLPALPRWAVIGLAGFVLLVIAMVASDRAREVMQRPAPATIGATK